MARVISNPLPQPPERASTPGTGRGRAVSFTPRGRSSSREASRVRNTSPLRELANSWGSFFPTSPSLSTPVGSRPSTAKQSHSASEEKRFWWSLRDATRRPWFDESEEHSQDVEESTFAHDVRDVPPVARESSSLWHRRGSIPPEQGESWRRTKEVSLQRVP